MPEALQQPVGVGTVFFLKEGAHEVGSGVVVGVNRATT
jgi:hypothetical protein